MVLLDIQNLTKHFGGLVAVNDLNLSVHKGEILGLNTTLTHWYKNTITRITGKQEKIQDKV